MLFASETCNVPAHAAVKDERRSSSGRGRRRRTIGRRQFYVGGGLPFKA